jgi:hypothetical protein
VSRDGARVDTQLDELAAPVVRAEPTSMTTTLPRWQLRTPVQEMLAAQQTTSDNATVRIDRMRLDHALGQVDPYTNGAFSDNLALGLPPFLRCRLMTDLHHQS